MECESTIQKSIARPVLCCVCGGRGFSYSSFRPLTSTSCSLLKLKNEYDCGSWCFNVRRRLKKKKKRNKRNRSGNNSPVNHVPDGDTWASEWSKTKFFMEKQFVYDLAVSVHSWASRLMLPHWTAFRWNQKKKRQTNTAWAADGPTCRHLSTQHKSSFISLILALCLTWHSYRGTLCRAN